LGSAALVFQTPLAQGVLLPGVGMFFLAPDKTRHGLAVGTAVRPDFNLLSKFVGVPRDVPNVPRAFRAAAGRARAGGHA